MPDRVWGLPVGHWGSRQAAERLVSTHHQQAQGGCTPAHSTHSTQPLGSARTTQRNATQHNTTQRSAAQRSTAQHSTAQHSTAQHSTAQHSTAQHSTARITAHHDTLHGPPAVAGHQHAAQAPIPVHPPVTPPTHVAWHAQTLQAFMIQRQVPRRLRNRIKAFFDYTTRRQVAKEEQEFINGGPSG